jgi:hypothetical protein
MVCLAPSSSASNRRAATRIVDGQLDKTCRCRRVVALDRGGDGEKGVGDGQRGPAVPGGPPPDLVLVHSGEALGSLERFVSAVRPHAPGRPAVSVAANSGQDHFTSGVSLSSGCPHASAFGASGAGT